MSKVVCHICKNAIEYTHQWFGLCCPTCYRTTPPKYNVGEEVYFIRDVGIKGTNFKEATIVKGKIFESRKVIYYHANDIGLYAYKIDVLEDNKRYSRHESKIYRNKSEIEALVEHTNKRRIIERELRAELKERMSML